MKKYGMPYMGSKTKIADKIMSMLPSADYFVDLFGGGGAMSHCAALSGKYKHTIYNDIEPIAYKGFTMALNGEFASESRWISRDDFYRLKDTDPYAAICFSFGNDLKSYAYAPEIERFKKHLHNMFFAETPKARRLQWKNFIREFSLVKFDIKNLTHYALDLCRMYGVEPVFDIDSTLNVGKTKKRLNSVVSEEIRLYLRNALDKSGLKQSEVDKYLGNQMSGHYFGSSQWALPTEEQYKKLCEILPELSEPWELLNHKLSVLQKLDTLQRLESLQSLQSLQRLESLQSLQSLQRLESLQSLQRLESLQSLQRLESLDTKIQCFNQSYEKIFIPKNSVIYCDIPYKDTKGYNNTFNHNEFYRWARGQKGLVYISEYQMPDDFYVVVEMEKVCTLSLANRKKTVEKLFCNKKEGASLI